MRCKPKGFSRHRLGHSIHFVENPSGMNRNNPCLYSPFPLSHPRFSRFFRNRFIRKNAEPDLSSPLNKPGHRDSSRLQLSCRDPARFHCLESELTEGKLGSTIGLSRQSTFHLFSEFYFLRTQHLESFTLFE